MTASETSARPRVILIVEDHEDSAAMLEVFLSSLGYEILLAEGGFAALALPELGRVDLALIDIGLADMDGYALASALRAQLGERCPPLVALSGYSAPRDRAEARARGFASHLGKPVNFDELTGVAEELLAKAKR